MATQLAYVLDGKLTFRSDEVFSSRASMDAIFHLSKKEFDDSADVLLVGHEDGTINLSIYDFFEIGTFDAQQISHNLQTSKPLLHSSHPLCSSHAVIFCATHSSRESVPQNGEELFFVPFDLRLIPETGRYLSLLASKSTQLQNVLRYIRETQIQVYNEFKSSQELPHKFIRNIEDALHENNEGNFMIATYHLVVTGNCYPSMKEWLVEELGERVCFNLTVCEIFAMANDFTRVTNDGKRLHLVVMRTSGGWSTKISFLL